MMEVERIGGFHVRRMLFEHSMQVPLLVTASLTDSIDPRELIHSPGGKVERTADGYPYVSRSEFNKVVDAWMPSFNWRDSVVSTLCTNMPEAVLAVNPQLGTIGAEDWPSPIPDFNPAKSDEDIKLPLPELVAYIYLQISSKKLASTYRQTADSKWPDENALTAKPSILSDPDLSIMEKKRSQPGSSAVLKATVIQDIQREMTLIIENLELLLEIIAECYGEDVKQPEILIPKEYVNHLSFLLTSGCDELGKQEPLYKEFPEWQRDPDTRLAVKDVARTIIKSLRVTAERDVGAKVQEVKNLEKKTVLRTGTPHSPLYGQDVRVLGCNDSYIYLLNAMARVSIIGCMDCTIFVGGATSLSIIGCGRAKVIALARSCRVSNCVDTTLFLCTSQVPQVVGDTRAIVFAPYNASYDNFERDAKAVGVDPTENLWKDFHVPLSTSFSTSSPAKAGIGSSGEKVPASVVSILPPEKFFPFVVPVAKEDGTKTSSGVTPAPQAAPLPPEYSAIINERTVEVDAMRKAVRNAQAKLSAEGSNNNGPGPDLQSVVQEYFREWLISSGNLRQINDLMRLEDEYSSQSTK